MNLETASPNGNVGWSDLNLNEIQTERSTESSTKSELAAGNYKFKLVSAKQNPFPERAGTTDIDFVVVEGTSARRHLFASIPPPHVTKYAAQWAAILIKRLGGEQLPGEDLVAILNRIAPTANAFTMDVIDDTWTDSKTGALRSKPKAQFFSIQAA
jgi:hypothetical protein